MSEVFSQEAGLVCSKTIEIQKLKEENKLLRECVEFYADISRWSGSRIIGDHFTDFENGNASIFISGEKARKTLAKIKGDV